MGNSWVSSMQLKLRFEYGPNCARVCTKRKPCVGYASAEIRGLLQLSSDSLLQIQSLSSYANVVVVPSFNTLFNLKQPSVSQKTDLHV